MGLFEPGTRCLLVAEVGQSHDGSLGTAHAYVDAAAKAGADVVKFQTHLAEAESHPSEPWRVHFSKQDATRYDYWKRMEFAPEEWVGLYDHCREKGVLFASSPFSLEAVSLLQRTGIDIWKVASGEVTNTALLSEIASDGRPALLSTGMSTTDEIERAVRTLRNGCETVALLQCTSKYPCPPEDLNLAVMKDLREVYGLPTGLSDHSGTIFGGLMAASLGARVVEVHVTLSREAFGPDVTSSITITELATLRQGLDFIHQASSTQKTKNAIADELLHVRNLFTKSLVTRREVSKGSVLQRDDLTVKKPGNGIPADKIDSVIGRVVTRDLGANEILQFSDLTDIQ